MCVYVCVYVCARALLTSYTVAIWAQAILAQVLAISSWTRQHRLAQSATLTRMFAISNGMGPDQGQTTDEQAAWNDGGKGGSKRHVGLPTKTASTQVRSPLYALSCTKTKAGCKSPAPTKTPNPGTALKQGMKVATEEP